MPLPRLLVTTFIALHACSGPIWSQATIAEQQDLRVIENLRNGGSDTSKVHDIDFFLLLHSEAEASATAQEVKEIGYRIHAIARSPDGSQWQVHAKRSMVPEVSAMNEATRKLEALAQRHGGYYDGWGTAPVK